MGTTMNDTTALLAHSFFFLFAKKIEMFYPMDTIRNLQRKYEALNILKYTWSLHSQ